MSTLTFKIALSYFFVLLKTDLAFAKNNITAEVFITALGYLLVICDYNLPFNSVTTDRIVIFVVWLEGVITSFFYFL